MDIKKALFHFNVVLALTVAIPVLAQVKQSEVSPVEHTYTSAGGIHLKAFVFSPAPQKASVSRSAIVIFHGGGWVAGEPSWGFGDAQRFAQRGMVAIVAQYRLSDQKSVTPIDAMADARAVIRWVRTNATSLGVDPDRIAAYGWSAGGHLAASAAIFDPDSAPVSCAPNALVLNSPAVAASSDDWFKQILLGKAAPDTLSPDQHVRKNLPPTIILQGRLDTVTPLAGAQRFCDRMKAEGNRCELNIYEGVGHLFSPLPDSGWPKPDPAIRAAAQAKSDQFLVSLGYMK